MELPNIFTWNEKRRSEIMKFGNNECVLRVDVSKRDRRRAGAKIRPPGD